MPSISPVSRPHRLRRFAAEYVKNGFQAQRAVLSAGFTKNPNSAAVIANRLLNDVMWDEVAREVMQESKMSADEVLERLTKVARSEADLKGSDVVKANELLGKFHKLFVDRTESSVTTFDSSSFKAKMSRNIAKLASKSGDDPLEIEREYQLSYADKSDEDYSPDLDASVHPEVWPSGCLISNAVNELAPQEISGEQ